MEYVKKLITTDYGVDAEAWVVSHIDINPSLDVALVRMDGYANATALFGNSKVLGSMKLKLENISELTLDTDETNVYTIVSIVIISKILEYPLFVGGEVLDV